MTSDSGVRMDVVALPPRGGEWTPPWPVAAYGPGEWMVLHGRATPGEVGAVAASIVAENDAPRRGSARDVVRALAAMDGYRITGGIRVSDAEGNVVEPGCCCNLEEWREWLDVTDGRSSPWMGHGPWGWVEHDGGALRVCSGPETDDPSGHGPAETVVAVPRAALPRLLDGVRADLDGFTARLREWAAAIDPEAGERLAERFAASFVRVGPPPADAPADGRHGVSPAVPGRVSIIVPALDEAAGIEATLRPLQPLRARGHEVIVVDGGSTDDTAGLARPLADRVLVSARGRARQQNAGADAATGAILLFLHADTRLPDGADEIVVREMERTGAGWGRFDVRLTGRHPALRVVERMIGLRSRLSGIATGDQAIFVRRDWFERAGRFPDVPLMEDVALSRALKRLGRPLCLRETATTSSRRWEERGVFRTVVLMWRLRWAYWRGADPAELARRYR